MGRSGAGGSPRRSARGAAAGPGGPRGAHSGGAGCGTASARRTSPGDWRPRHGQPRRVDRPRPGEARWRHQAPERQAGVVSPARRDLRARSLAPQHRGSGRHGQRAARRRRRRTVASRERHRARAARSHAAQWHSGPSAEPRCPSHRWRGGPDPGRLIGQWLGQRAGAGPPVRFDPDLPLHRIGSRDAGHGSRRARARRSDRRSLPRPPLSIGRPGCVTRLGEGAGTCRPERAPQGRCARGARPCRAPARGGPARAPAGAARGRRDHHRGGARGAGGHAALRAPRWPHHQRGSRRAGGRHDRRAALRPVRAHRSRQRPARRSDDGRRAPR